MSVSRRDVLKFAGATAAGTALAGLDPWRQLWATASERTAVPMAMHVHSSFSEGTASMAWQLAQAQASQIPVVWWTDHDFRMEAWAYRHAIHCSALTEAENGSKITWGKVLSGSPTGVVAQISTVVGSPLDPAPTGSMRLAATGAGSTFSTARMTVQDAGARHNTQASLAGQEIHVDVLPERIGPDAYLEIRIRLSDQPAGGGVPAGAYYLCYRVGGPAPPGEVQRQGRTGVVSLSAPTGSWTTLTLRPTDDIARIWPWLVPADNSMAQFSVAVGARRGASASGNVDYIRFVRTTSGSTPLDVQREISQALAPAYPDITQHHGLEVSLYPAHLNWYGGTIALPDYGTAGLSPRNDPTKTRALVGMIHDAGGLASYNHMFGSGFGGGLATAKQEELRTSVTSTLVANAAFGVDILEVGYRVRGGVTLSRHLSAWDVCSRNALFLTGNGVSDSHEGTWIGNQCNFVTTAFADDRTVNSLVGALAAGLCTFSDPDRFRGAIDLTVDGTCPMGSVSVSSLDTRQLSIGGAGLPPGGNVVLVQGPVDSPGSTVTDPATTRTSIPASAFQAGPVDIELDTEVSTFVRAEVRDAAGLFVAGSNPVWLLRDAPAAGIPRARAV